MFEKPFTARPALRYICPYQYREEEEFYPLQLRYVLNETPADLDEKEWQDKIVFAAREDIPEWIELVHLVIDGFPHLDEKQYLEQLQEYIKNNRALISLGYTRSIEKEGQRRHFVKRHCMNLRVPHKLV